MNAQPVFCCYGMAQLFVNGKISLMTMNDMRTVAFVGHFSDGIPLNYCPSCGKEFRLTFLTDSEVEE